MSNNTNQGISVILVEDDVVLSASLTEYLSLMGFQVKAVANGKEFFKALSEQAFTVAVIDLGLPDQSGEVLVDYARQNSSMSLVVITANDDLNARVGSYQSGADLFMGKPVDGRELAAALTSLASRQKARQTRDQIEKADDTWLLDNKNWVLVTPDQQRIECTSKEFRLLELLSEKPTEAVKRSHILDVLYARDDHSAQRALDTLVRRVRQKIAGVYEGGAPIRTAYSIGYIFAAPILPIRG